MATIFSHAVVGYTIAKLTNQPQKSTKLPLIAAVCAMLPDADVITFSYGIAYESYWGHRGFSHSVLFALLIGLFYFLVVCKSQKHLLVSGVVIFAATLSHGLIDACTDGGLGVGFAIPFWGERYFFPFTPLRVSPIGVRFFSHYGFTVLKSEFLYLVVPCLSLLSIKYVFNKMKSKL
ncbi:MAG: metal-dependent hydrolase [Bacteroidetes bacterium]|nr:metal-dependent hydrolase [Bacteroidota bacterium]